MKYSKGFSNHYGNAARLLKRRANENGLTFAVFIILAYAAAIYKFGTTPNINSLTIFTIYGALTTSYLIARFWLSLKHMPDRFFTEKIGAWPGISVIVPAYNESKTIYDTVEAIVNSRYQKGRLEIIVVNDGSTDDTNFWIEKAVEDFRGRFVGGGTYKVH